MSRQYLIRRLLLVIPAMLGISVVLFTVLALAPGDPFEELASNPAVPPEVRAALRASFGLDDPVYLRYLHWITAMLQGDWGFSFVSRMNVDTLILQRLPTTLIVIGSSQLLAILEHDDHACPVGHLLLVVEGLGIRLLGRHGLPLAIDLRRGLELLFQLREIGTNELAVHDRRPPRGAFGRYAVPRLSSGAWPWAGGMDPA